MLRISVPLVSFHWTSVNESVAPVGLLRLRKNYHCDWKSQLFFVCTARHKMDNSNSLRIPPLSASQKFVSYSLVAQSRFPCSVRCGYAAVHLLGLWFQIPPRGMDVCLVGAVCCQVQVSVLGWSLTQKSPINCDASIIGRSWTTRGCCTMGGGGIFWHIYTMQKWNYGWWVLWISS